MLKLISHGADEDYSIDGLFEIPAEFNVQEEFSRFLEQENISTGDFGDEVEQARRRVLLRRLTGTEHMHIWRTDLIVPWLRSRGFRGVKYDECRLT